MKNIQKDILRKIKLKSKDEPKSHLKIQCHKISECVVTKWQKTDENFLNFLNSFEQSDGQKRSESAIVNGLGSDAEEIVITGSYSFVADDGQTYTVEYVADKNGTKLLKRSLNSLINEIFLQVSNQRPLTSQSKAP